MDIVLLQRLLDVEHVSVARLRNAVSSLLNFLKVQNDVLDFRMEIL